MSHTYRTSPNNSTPFSSCCNVASMDSYGRPDSKCHRCGEPMLFDDDGLSARRRKIGPGCCLLCGMRRGDPAISGNCDC